MIKTKKKTQLKQLRTDTDVKLSRLRQLNVIKTVLVCLKVRDMKNIFKNPIDTMIDEKRHEAQQNKEKKEKKDIPQKTHHN